MTSLFEGTPMGIIVNIDVMLARRKMSVTELAERVGITMANLSILKNGRARAIRFSTLEGICRALDCQPGDILEYGSNDAPKTAMAPTAGDSGGGPRAGTAPQPRRTQPRVRR
jgi:putative transcriptional regulator